MKNNHLNDTCAAILGMLIDARRNDADGGRTFLSGSDIGAELGISRNAVCKSIHRLCDLGYAITSEQSHGYSLEKHADVISAKYLETALGHKVPKITVLDSAPSTNDCAKLVPFDELPALIVADEQTAGRGRSGRSFFSPGGMGIYMSYVFHPMFPVTDAMSITAGTAVAVRETLSELCGCDFGIKWVNDIYKGDRKVAGILTEGISSIEEAGFERIIIGIGINCFSSPLPDDLKRIAGFLSDEDFPKFTREEIIVSVTKKLEDLFRDKTSVDTSLFAARYRDHCITPGKRVLVSAPGKESFEADAVSVGDDFALVVKARTGPDAGREISVCGGEASILPFF